VINPYAGLGGSVGLKGSDGSSVRQRAYALGAKSQIASRLAIVFDHLVDYRQKLQFVGFDGPLAADYLNAAGWHCHIIGATEHPETTARDTEAAAKALEQYGVDLLLFAGGDGTARNVYNAVSEHQAVLGLPCGVKMHSGVFAISPLAAGTVIEQLIDGRLVSVAMQEVRDINEDDLRAGSIQSKYYGELLVPDEVAYIQSTKVSGREVEALVVADIAAEVVESMEDEVLYIIGPGTTPAEIMHELGLANTLLGFDVVCRQQLWYSDATEQQLCDAVDSHAGEVRVVLTATGGQGHLIGRGNQQLSAALLSRLGKEALMIVATKTKLEQLDSRPLRLDSGDVALDRLLTGYYQIITGYRDYVMYQVSG
jgi:predicted polyphosphate/ATP-dependent NAD kinase